jgi:hypothetical protein
MPIPDAVAGTPPLDERDTEHGIPEKERKNVFEEANKALREAIRWHEDQAHLPVRGVLPDQRPAQEVVPSGLLDAIPTASIPGRLPGC